MPRLKRRKHGEGVSHITCRLCGREFQAITGTHLVRRHGLGPDHPVREYMKRFRIRSPESHEAAKRRHRRLIDWFERQGRRWTRARIIRALRQYGPRATRRDIEDRNPQLVHAVTNTFGRWRVACAAAGFEYVHAGTRWTRETVVRAIRKERRSCRPINAKAVRRRNSKLASAAFARFGSWKSALEAAGINPERVVLARTWTGPALLDAIRATFRAHHDLGFATMKDRDQGLFGAALRRFGSWREALRAAGIDPDSFRRYKDRSPQKIIAVLRADHRAGRPLNFNSTRRRDGALVGAALRKFGSWDATLRAVGVRPEAVRLARSWTPERVLKLVRAEHRARKPMNYKAVQTRIPGLVDAAAHRFGTWDATLRKAGLDPSRIRLGPRN